MRSFLSAGSWLVLIVAAEAGRARGDTPADARVAALIEQLGDASYARREAAGRALAAAGEPALPAVRRAALASSSPEVRRRAERVARSIMLAARPSRSTGLQTELVNPGTFLMGSPRGEYTRRPDELQHAVRITRPFLLGKFEVTQAEYLKVMKFNPSWFAESGEGKARVRGRDTGRFPVENVSWYDAVEFCNRLSRLDGYAPYYELADVRREGDSIQGATVKVIGGNGYRLPTEAEWEYACRAGTHRAFHYGDSGTGAEANLRPGPAIGYGSAPNWDVLDRTAAVGAYKPNLWGLHDMHGNAGEWCWDWYDRDYYARSPEDDPSGPERGTHRVLRGGSWQVNERSCRSASRFYLTPDQRNYYTGFRVARTP